MNDDRKLEVATLAGGCFWCLEAVYAEIKGVEKVESGFSGGKGDKVTYEEVCRGDTGHAEVVRITFDPEVVSYGDLLDVFFTVHDPTTLNRQGGDVGTQYRSAIYWHSPEQRKIAEQAIAEVGAAGIWKNPIVTEIAPYAGFVTAGKYHENYFARNQNQPYCQMVIAPKVAKFRKHHLERLAK